MKYKWQKYDNEELRKIIGNRAKQRRIELGLKQRDVAIRMGVATSTIVRYEAGTIDNTKKLVLEGLSLALNVSEEWLRGEADEMGAPPIGAGIVRPVKPAFWPGVLTGADYEALIHSPSDDWEMLKDILEYARDNRIYCFAELVDICANDKPDWFKLIVERRCCYIVDKYIKSLEWERDNRYDRRVYL